MKQITFILCLCAASIVRSQNPIPSISIEKVAPLLGPSMASDSEQVFVLISKQSVGSIFSSVSSVYNTYIVGINKNFNKFGLGLITEYENNGPIWKGLYNTLSTSYTLNTSDSELYKNSISFGISGTLCRRSLSREDSTNINPKHFVNLNLGISSKFEFGNHMTTIGVSYTKLNRPNTSFLTGGIFKEQPLLNIFAFGTFKLNHVLNLKPQFFYLREPIQDANANHIIFGGTSFSVLANSKKHRINIGGGIIVSRNTGNPYFNMGYDANHWSITLSYHKNSPSPLTRYELQSNYRI